MRHLKPVLAWVAVLALTSLACQTITTLPQRLAGEAATAVPVIPTVPPDQPAGPAPTEAAAGPASSDALVIPGGPTIGSPRETRVAAAGDVQGLDQVAAESYSDTEMNQVGARLTYTIQVDQAATQLLWGYAWCATTPEILAQNVAQMQVEFVAGGQTVPESQLEVFDGQNQSGQACHVQRAVVYNWPSGTATLETRITFLQAVNDGMGDYPAGDQVFTYAVTAP